MSMASHPRYRSLAKVAAHFVDAARNRCGDEQMRLAHQRAAVVAAALITLLLAGFSEPAPSAIQRFQADRAALEKDAQRQDWAASVADAERLRDFLNDAPTSRLEVARAKLRAGDRIGGLVETTAFLELGETNAILASPLFQPISQAIKPRIDENATAISRGQPAFSLSDASLVAEDIDYDPASRRFFITTILGKAIVSVDAAGAQRTFATSPDGWPMVALKLDRKRRRLWASEVAFDGFQTVPSAAWGRSVLLEYDLDSARLLRRLEGPPRSGLGDMALAANGDPIVSDGDGGGVYRVIRGVLIRLDHGEFISPQTPTFCDDPSAAFVPDYVRGLARLDLKTGQVRWFDGAKHALDGIDGLYCRGRTLYAAQNGASPNRVIAFRLNASKTAVIGEEILERATLGFGQPTHGVLVGERFYYIANSGWDVLGDHGELKPGARFTSAVVMRFTEVNRRGEPARRQGPT